MQILTPSEKEYLAHPIFGVRDADLRKRVSARRRSRRQMPAGPGRAAYIFGKSCDQITRNQS